MTTPDAPLKKSHGLSTPLEGTPAPPWDPSAPIAAPLCMYRPTVLPESKKPHRWSLSYRIYFR